MSLDNSGEWISCDSRADLDSRLALVRESIAEHAVTDEASSWGYMITQDLVVPVGFVDVGIKPHAVTIEDVIAIGAGECIFGISRSEEKVIFRYRMPTVFHEFLSADRRGFLIQDEIGFVWLSKYGAEIWKSCIDDIVEGFTIKDGIIEGKTFEGRTFTLRIPGYV